MSVMQTRPAIMRAIFGVVLGFAAVPAVSATTMAAKPAKSSSWTGSWTRASQTSMVTFQISKNGKSVTNMSLPNGEPVFCQGGGFGLPVRQAKPAWKNGHPICWR